MNHNREEKIDRPRGRPKTSDIAFLIVQGMKSESGIKCRICNRVFPRLKSLNAHISTHNDVKKYACNFPHCPKSFKQSSQLKNHQYLHSREKPFKCPSKGCLVRFAHSHRNCPAHPDFKLVKQLETTEEIRLRFYQDVENLSENDKQWFEKYLADREKKLQQVLGKVKLEDEDSSEISEDQSEKTQEEQQIQQKLQTKKENWKDGQLLYSFFKDLHKKGGNSKALFEESCNFVNFKYLCDTMCEQSLVIEETNTP